MSMSGGTMHSLSTWCSWWLCRPFGVVWLFKLCSSLTGDSWLPNRYSFSKLHMRSVCTPTDMVSAACAGTLSAGFDEGDVGDVGVGADSIDGNEVVEDSLVIDCCWVVVGGLRRFTSTNIGSGAFRNSLTASSCAKLLTSLPFTWK